MMTDRRLLIVAGDPLARAGLVTLLVDRPGLQVVGQVDAGERLGAEVAVYRPDAIVWDLGWEPEDSLGMLEDLAAEEGWGPAIVVLLADEELAPAAWAAGARGLLYRDVSGERLATAVTTVIQGLVVMEPEISAAFAPAGSVGEPDLDEPLTPRELEVLQLLAEGLANRAIAQRLEISEHTVKFHINAIMSKLGAQSRTAAVVQATRLGLIML